MKVVPALPPRRACAQKYASVLVHAGNSAESDALVWAATDIANLFGAQLVGVSTPPGAVFAEQRHESEQDTARRVLEAAAARFEARTSTVRAGVCWRPAEGPPAAALRRLAWAADLIVVNRGGPAGEDDEDATLKSLVVGAGRPVLVRPPGASRIPFKRIAVAWDGSAAAARALASALPFLAKADQVRLFALDGARGPRGREALERVREGLALRAVAIELAPDPEAGRASAGGGRFGDFDPDLVVMGAWGRRSVLPFTDPTDRAVTELTCFALLGH